MKSIDMSAIDQYLYTCLGVIECPVPYSFFIGNEATQPIYVAIYHLEQDIPEYEDDFQGKKGDILVGGDGGEAPAMLIPMPETLHLYSDDDAITVNPKVFWKPTQTYMLGVGYKNLGWNPEKDQLEWWLMEHVLAFLTKTYPATFSIKNRGLDLEQNGSICRVLTDEEEKIGNWRKYRSEEQTGNN